MTTGDDHPNEDKVKEKKLHPRIFPFHVDWKCLTNGERRDRQREMITRSLSLPLFNTSIFSPRIQFDIRQRCLALSISSLFLFYPIEWEFLLDIEEKRITIESFEDFTF